MPGNTPAAGDVLECRVVCAALGQQIGMNVLHYGVRTTISGGCTIQEFVNGLDTDLAPFYKNLISSNALYRGIGAANLIPPRTTEFSSIANAGVGTAGPNLLPTQVRGLISLYTPLAGRSNRGRVYIPFPPTNGATVDGDPTAGYVVFLGALRNRLIIPITIVGAVGTSTFEPMIRHKVGGPFAATVITSGIARSRFATQRRSGAYGRQNQIPF